MVKSLVPFLEGEDKGFPGVVFHALVETLAFDSDDLFILFDGELVLGIAFVPLFDVFLGPVHFDLTNESAVVVVSESYLEHVEFCWNHQFNFIWLVHCCSQFLRTLLLILTNSLHLLKPIPMEELQTSHMARLCGPFEIEAGVCLVS